MKSVQLCTMATYLLVIGWFSTAPALGWVCESRVTGPWWSPEVWSWSITGVEDAPTEVPTIPGPGDDVIVNHAIMVEGDPIYVQSLTVGEGGVISGTGSDLEIWTTGDMCINEGGYIECNSDPNTMTGGELTLVSGNWLTLKTSGEIPAIHADYDITLKAHEGISFLESTGICVLSDNGPIIIQVPLEERILLEEGFTLTDVVVPEPAIMEVLVIDDFEDYPSNYESEYANWIWLTWQDGYYDPNNGSTVGNEGDLAELEIVHSGRKSMPLSYNNTEGVTESVVYRTFDPPQDWSHYDVLSMWIYGDPNNVVTETDRFFVCIEDTKCNIATLINGEPNTLLIPAWKWYSVTLEELYNEGVDAGNIASIAIGIEGTNTSGLAYIDDIHLQNGGLPPQIIYPKNGTVITLPVYILAWTAVYIPGISYQVTIWECDRDLQDRIRAGHKPTTEDLAGQSVFLVRDGIYETFLLLPVPQHELPVPNHVYIFQVQAKESSGLTYDSDIGVFYTSEPTTTLNNEDDEDQDDEGQDDLDQDDESKEEEVVIQFKVLLKNGEEVSIRLIAREVDGVIYVYVETDLDPRGLFMPLHICGLKGIYIYKIGGDQKRGENEPEFVELYFVDDDGKYCKARVYTSGRECGLVIVYEEKGFEYEERCRGETGETSIDLTAEIAVNAFIGPGAEIGARTHIGKRVSIGSDVTIDEDVVVKDWTHIGNDTEIDRGTTIGCSAWIGNNVNIDDDVNIGDCVEIGDGTEIDPGTKIGSNAKLGKEVDIDDDVTIGDRVEIGDGTEIDTEVVIGNGTQIGRNVHIDDEVVIGNNVVIGDGASIEGGVVVPDGTVIPAGHTYP